MVVIIIVFIQIYGLICSFSNFPEGYFPQSSYFVEDMWDHMESVLKRVAEDEDILSMTNIELVRYLKAMGVME